MTQPGEDLVEPGASTIEAATRDEGPQALDVWLTRGTHW